MAAPGRKTAESDYNNMYKFFNLDTDVGVIMRETNLVVKLDERCQLSIPWHLKPRRQVCYDLP
jgi:hypothetical protein